MELIKYRMINPDGSWIETLDEKEAIDFGNYEVIIENIPTINN